jgi:glycosyltransferase involved in cell wall biosynthesis
MKRKLAKILALEPYYGGSHKSFLDGLAALFPDSIDLITLPARKWKWRMRLSGPWLAAELAKVADPEQYNCLLCSTFVDVASLKGLAPAWAARLPVCTYFHENQFAYPVQVENERDFHFSLTNVTTALASDRLAFNSQYNLDSFLTGCRRLLKKSYDMKLSDIEQAVRAKALVISPGQDFSLIDQQDQPAGEGGAPVIVWNHRWEHDKNPEQFFQSLFELDRQGVDFRLIVLGESFRAQPQIFAEAQKRLAARIIRFGYAESREEYVRYLRQGDLVLSTAGHEFFGISVIEAVRAGCRPLLPRRLSYPELFPGQYLYNDEDLADRITESLTKGRLSKTEAIELTDEYSWPALTNAYRDWLGLDRVVC